MEMAILTIWSDKQVEENELQFLSRLAKHLSFHQEDLEGSLIALEGFVLQHWDELGQLQNKKAFQQVSDQFIKRIAKIVAINKPRLINEVKKNPELLRVLEKAQSTELGLEDKLMVKDAILELLKSIPNFATISLPQKFLTLPVLLKILPKDFFKETLS